MLVAELAVADLNGCESSMARFAIEICRMKSLVGYNLAPCLEEPLLLRSDGSFRLREPSDAKRATFETVRGALSSFGPPLSNLTGCLRTERHPSHRRDVAPTAFGQVEKKNGRRVSTFCTPKATSTSLSPSDHLSPSLTTVFLIFAYSAFKS